LRTISFGIPVDQLDVLGLAPVHDPLRINEPVDQPLRLEPVGAAPPVQIHDAAVRLPVQAVVEPFTDVAERQVRAREDERASLRVAAGRPVVAEVEPAVVADPVSLLLPRLPRGRCRQADAVRDVRVLVDPDAVQVTDIVDGRDLPERLPRKHLLVRDTGRGEKLERAVHLEACAALFHRPVPGKRPVGKRALLGERRVHLGAERASVSAGRQAAGHVALVGIPAAADRGDAEVDAELAAAVERVVCLPFVVPRVPDEPVRDVVDILGVGAVLDGQKLRPVVVLAELAERRLADLEDPVGGVQLLVGVPFVFVADAAQLPDPFVPDEPLLTGGERERGRPASVKRFLRRRRGAARTATVAAAADPSENQGLSACASSSASCSGKAAAHAARASQPNRTTGSVVGSPVTFPSASTAWTTAWTMNL
jgi:hypothetical protein